VLLFRAVREQLITIADIAEYGQIYALKLAAENQVPRIVGQQSPQRDGFPPNRLKLKQASAPELGRRNRTKLTVRRARCRRSGTSNRRGDRADAERDAEIIRLDSEDYTQAQIADAVGLRSPL
jgi:hypothetical protein